MGDGTEGQRRDAVTRQLLELFAHKETRPEYLATVVEILREWSGCRCVGIRILDEAGNIPYGAYTGFTEDFWRLENDLCIHCDNCICIHVIGERIEPHERQVTTGAGSIRSNDLNSFAQAIPAHARSHYRGECLRRGFQSMAVVPIRFRGRVMGAIHFADERPGMLGDEVIGFVESITVLVGEAIHRFNMEEMLRRNLDVMRRQARQLRALATQLTQSEQRERKRMAEVLHDNLQQLLVGARYQLSIVQRRDDLAMVRALALDVDKIILEAIGVTRSLNSELNPHVQHGLRRALDWLGRWMQEKQGLDVDVEADESANPDSQVVMTLMVQCARELLFNVVKHAKVKRARVSMRRGADGRAEIEISDEGVGFDAKQVEARDGGSGLNAIRERMEMLGGEFVIDCAPGRGSRFVLVEPAQEETPAEPQKNEAQLAPARNGKEH